MAIGPGGNSIFIPTGPAPDYTQFLENDPFYKQELSWINEAQALAAKRLAEDRSFAERAYGLNVSQAQSSGSGGGDYGLAAAQANAALQREKLTRDNANQAEFLREAMASRGMASSGQNLWEQNERTFQFNLANKGIDQDLAARASAAAEARSEAQSRMALQLQELALGQEQRMMGFGRDAEDLALGTSRARGEAAFNLYNRLKADGKLLAPGEMALWDDESQLYVTRGGIYYDAFGNRTSWQRAVANNGAATGGAPYSTDSLSGYVPGSNVITDYSAAPSRPAFNPIPGGWGYD
jgi:hypothetical protein